MNDFASCDARINASRNGSLKDLPKPVCPPALSNAGQRRMIRQLFVQSVTGKPSNREINLSFPHQATAVNNAQQHTRQHQAQRGFGINAGTAVISAITVGDLFAQPTEIKDAINARQNIIVGDQLAKRAGNKQLKLASIFLSPHNSLHNNIADTPLFARFFNDPTVHFYRNVFSHVPKAKVREVAHMLKAIHAQESRETAIEKADAVVASLRTMRLNKAADLVEEKIHETLSYYSFPDSHWRKIRTNNPLERLMKEIRRRTRVVGAFPDGQSCLNLAAARLRHVAGTQWSTRKYMAMDPLQEMKLHLNGAAGA